MKNLISRTAESMELCDDLNSLEGDFRYIQLTKGQITKVDKEDYEWLIEYRWCAQPNRKSYYAKRSTTVNKKLLMLLMHRLIWIHHNGAIPERYEIDHIDQDKLNNSLSNLRLVSHSQNMINKPKASGKSSKYLGVHFNKQKNKWRGQIAINSKQYHLGWFKTEIEAAKVRDEYAKNSGLYLDSNLNFPKADKPLKTPIAELYHL
jgi:frataxin-like iron-binding protein CyaY